MGYNADVTVWTEDRLIGKARGSFSRQPSPGEGGWGGEIVMQEPIDPVDLLKASVIRFPSGVERNISVLELSPAIGESGLLQGARILGLGDPPF